jgi:hypothetical protein
MKHVSQPFDSVSAIIALFEKKNTWNPGNTVQNLDISILAYGHNLQSRSSAAMYVIARQY